MEEGGVSKGTWLPEEDRVLTEYVAACGAQNWGALLANGLLNRSGKSCRLRWVNQLKPGLQVSEGAAEGVRKVGKTRMEIIKR